MKLVLDFDGVINFFSHNGTGGWPSVKEFVYYMKFSDVALRIKYSPDLVAEINALPVEKIFSSTWVVEPEILDEVGLRGFTNAFEIGMIEEARKAKLEYIYGLIDNGEPFVWIDDDAIPHGRYPENSMILRPLEMRGITPKEWARVKEFVHKST